MRPAAAGVLVSVVLVSLATVAQADPPPAAPSPDQRERAMRMVFDGFFGEAIERALASETPDDNGRLAETLYAEAAKRGAYPKFQVYALDHVIRLASDCPGKRLLAYRALRLQAACDMSLKRKCFEAMQLLVPMIVKELPESERHTWPPECIQHTVALAEMQIQDGRYGRARKTVDETERVLSEGKLPAAAPPKVRAMLDYIAGIERQYDVAVTGAKVAGKIQPADRLLMAVIELARGDRKRAVAHLAAVDPQASKPVVDFLQTGDGKKAAAKDFVRVARGLETLAKAAKHPWVRMTLLMDASAALGPGTKGNAAREIDHRQRDQLDERVTAAIKALAEKVPEGAIQYTPSFLGWRSNRAVMQRVSGQGFFGIGDPVASVVYVVDRSGSMTDTIMYVKYQLRRSIRTLKPHQKFLPVFYSTGPAETLPARKLVPATEANKLAAIEFIDSITPVGQTDPSDALRIAFAARPEVIYLLTDGEFDKKIVKLIDRLNGDKAVKVHTICFMFEDGEAMLKEIAKRNGGQYLLVGGGCFEAIDP